MIHVNADPGSICTCDDGLVHTLRAHPSMTIRPTLYSSVEVLTHYEDRLLLRSTIITPPIAWLANHPTLFNPQHLLSRAYTAEMRDPEPPPR